MELNLL